MDNGEWTMENGQWTTLPLPSSPFPLPPSILKVVSGATVDDNTDSCYQVTTGPTLELPASHSIYGVQNVHQTFEDRG